jgi:hypothetical protein
MKTSAFYSLLPGAALHLKPERAVAYGLPDRLVHFEGIKERPGRETPWTTNEKPRRNVLSGSNPA